jgi:hypothetical protein
MQLRASWRPTTQIVKQWFNTGTIESMTAVENFASKAKDKRRQSKDPIKHCKYYTHQHILQGIFLLLCGIDISLLRTAELHRLLCETLLKKLYQCSAFWLSI